MLKFAIPALGISIASPFMTCFAVNGSGPTNGGIEGGPHLDRAWIDDITTGETIPKEASGY